MLDEVTLDRLEKAYLDGWYVKMTTELDALPSNDESGYSLFFSPIIDNTLFASLIADSSKIRDYYDRPPVSQYDFLFFFDNGGNIRYVKTKWIING